ncbi:tRNA pseudouridine synthase B, partial [Cokeromyces recurvatus]|uniref:tRNA pseudouridine synthase B n=1 Tax=Cokeromyces recurvatus TaxID=90255 RepID=UPI00221F0505
DPLAEGVLVLGVGDGCKQLSTFLQCSKEYIVTAKFGEATDTYDAEGTVIQKCKTEHLNKQLIQDTLQKFKGHITQTPPLYSAVRLQGKRLYDYARLKLDLPEPIKTRQVFVEDIQLLDFHENSCKIRVVCGGGTYIRSIVHDMATQMETCAHVTALIRTRQGDFTIDDVYKLE